MKIAIISDTHDHICKLKSVKAVIDKYGCEAIVHCGDMVSPFTLKEIADWGIPLHFIFGNNEGERLVTANMAAGYENAMLYGEFGEFEVGGKRFAITHYPHYASGLAKEEKYDIVCFGHNHTQSKEQVGNTLVINPGTAAGYAKPAGMAVYDSETGEVEMIKL